MSYSTAELTDTKEIAVIPSAWLTDDGAARWPPYRSSTRLNNAVKMKEVACDGWETYTVRVMYKSGKF